GVRPSIEDPVLYNDVNINGTLNLLEICKQHNVKNFIFASSSSVYGNNKKVPFAESDPVDHPISPYASTKKAGELICHTYHHLEKMSIACLRFFTVYGPRQRPDLAIIKFTRKILAGESVPVYGDGSTRRDYTYIDDIIAGIVNTLDFVSSGWKYEVINLGESRSIALSEMISVIENATAKQAVKEYLPMQPGDVNITYADISKAKQLLGYDPQTDFEAGVDKFVRWFKENYKYTMSP
ncbi:GDP-mannose 4,6-dehydratase, partial [Candidatus Cloacimonadota bacterium]